MRGEREELTGWRDVFSSGLSGQLRGQYQTGSETLVVTQELIGGVTKLLPFLDNTYIVLEQSLNLR